jgi:non-specific protein-tyrosine kinase
MSAASTNGKPATADWLQPHVEEEGLSRYVQTIRERIWIVLAIMAITTGFAILYVATASDVYEARADMLVLPATADSQSLVNLPLIRESSDPTRDVETASRLITNIDVAERVQEELDSPASASDLLGDVTAEPVAQSNIVAVVAEAGTAEEAQALANAFARAAIEEQTETLHAYIDQTLPALEERATTSDDPALNAAVTYLQALRAADNPTLQVETEAELPSGPVSPRPRLSIAAGLLAGLVLGIAAAFAIQVLDPRLRREDQLRRLYRLPILGRIPREDPGRGEPTPLNPLGLSPAASEAYRTLRGTLAVAQRSANRDSTAVLVTGSSPSEGKTTTAINLASSLAAAGHSVILVESDLRRPAISRALGVTAQHGVVSVLIESVSLEQALVTTDDFGPNLGLLLADYEGGWITELFSLPTAPKLIEDARRIADFVIIDSPPLTDVIDALPLASYVDDVLIVTRLGRTRLSKLRQLGELLAENTIRPVGFVIVGTARPTRSDYHYYNVTSGQNPGRRSSRVPLTRGTR